MSEDELLTAVIALCKLMQLRVHHVRPARTEQGWRTPVQGHAGFPDLVIAGPAGHLFRELKSDTGRLTEDQVDWLVMLGPGSGIWRPVDLVSGLIRDELQRIAGKPKRT